MDARAGKHWSLFTDWCAAMGHQALPASYSTIGRFLRECPAGERTSRERVLAIAVAHAEAGEAMRVPPARVHVPCVAWQSGIDPVSERPWLSAADALAAIDPYGVPEGLKGRRDAFLVAAVAVCGLSLRQVRSLSASDVRFVDGCAWLRGVPLPVTRSRYSCPACAVARWLAVLAAWSRQWHGGYSPSTDEVLAVVAQLPDEGEHECRAPVPGGWGLAGVLSPALDHTQLPAFTLHAMSSQGVRRALRSRQDPARAGARVVAEPTPPEDSVPAETRGPSGRRMSRDEHDALDELFDDVESRIDAIMAAADRALAGETS